jgi:hypothetical protein
VAGAQIRIDQAANAIPLGTAGIARDDIIKGAAVTLRNGDPAGVKSSQWSLLDRPYGSSAVVANPTSAVATIVPDLPGEYRVRLQINAGGPGEYDVRTFAVRDAAGMALPALGVRGGRRAPNGDVELAGENNYAIGPGEFNTAGWQREMNERQLRALDNRDDPLVTDEVVNGDILVVAIDWGLPMGILQSLEISSLSSSTDITIYADAAASVALHTWSAVDTTAGWPMFEPKTVTGRLGAPLEDNKVYLQLANNGADTTYTVYYRIKAP